MPNGFGQITEIKNQNLRKPFRVMVTTGKNEHGKPICSLLKPEAYFKTYNEAYMALMEYNKNPYVLSSDITVEELYLQWIKYKYGDATKKETAWITSSWKYCSSVYNLKAIEIRPRHIKYCIDNGTVTTATGKTKKPPVHVKNLIKLMFGMMFDYAVEYELITHNFARDIKLNAKIKQEMEEQINEHITFSDDEIKKLWDNINSQPYIDMLLVQCYSGWRPQELIDLEISKIDLTTGFFIGGMKTKAGTNRLVPIHSRIQSLIEQRYEEAISINSKYLFNYKKGEVYIHFNYHYYRKVFSAICSELDLDPKHRPHDCRKHFITMAKKYDIDEYAIKYIVGHTISDITEKVYTERTEDWLKKEIEKIK